MIDQFDTRQIKFLKQRRETLGMSQRELEDRMEVSDRQIAKWETYIRSPTAANLDRWARALGLKLVLRKL